MALVGSIYFMLSPYFLLKLQLGFPSKLIFFWCPLFLDAILMLRKTGKIKYITLAFLYLVGCLLGYPQYVIYLLTTVIVMVLWDMFSREGRNRNLKTFVVILLFTPAAVIFFFYVHVGESPLFMLPSLDPTKYPSVDIFHFWRFFPVTYAPGVNKALPIGIPFIIFLLLIPGILRSKEEIQPLVVSAVVLLILSMGPILQTDFRAVDFFGSKILLPFYLFTSFGPMRSRIGFPVRALPLAILCMMPVVLLLLEDFKSQRNLLIKRIIPYILMFILIMETVISLPELYSDITTPVDVPEFFSEIMKDNGAVIHLPFEKPEPPHCYSILTAMSMHPQVNPLRPDPSIYNPLFKLYLLIHGFTEKHEIVLYCEELRKQGIRYIAVHRTLYSDLQKLTELENLLSIAFGNPYFSESSNIKIYTIPNPPK
jgi:hypothetical protein